MSPTAVDGCIVFSMRFCLSIFAGRRVPLVHGSMAVIENLLVSVIDYYHASLCANFSWSGRFMIAILRWQWLSCFFSWRSRVRHDFAYTIATMVLESVILPFFFWRVVFVVKLNVSLHFAEEFNGSTRVAWMTHSVCETIQRDASPPSDYGCGVLCCNFVQLLFLGHPSWH